MKRTAPPWSPKAEKPRREDPVTQAVRALVRGRSGGWCECCGHSQATHVHHRQLRRMGDHTVPNLLHLCSPCHTRLHGHIRYALDQGFIVSAYDQPAMREVLYRGRDWVFLGANGELVPS